VQEILINETKEMVYHTAVVISGVVLDVDEQSLAPWTWVDVGAVTYKSRKFVCAGCIAIGTYKVTIDFFYNDLSVIFIVHFHIDTSSNVGSSLVVIAE
jgi:hypothetical protein